ncbi:MAG: Holliday junction resolvase RuvX [Actinomycetia bacterium]|nr:Holliday junction resolvase RuvX [Actinomycetes bacterium]MCP4226626.1 Holliday junction resolvase RuvX [Actinomycetes bacterium]MCP5032662.1 Holliday junction resolvase RuvX [Actinomycetes bacterium]
MEVSSGRALGIDLGDKRIGIAICDADRLVATPLETINRVGNRPLEHDRIAELVADHEVTVVVVGLPLSLSGEVGPAARKVLSEVKGLRKRLAAEIVTHDERLSTVDAQGSLRRQGLKGQKGRAVIDQVAASVILQSWIDSGTRSHK